MTEEERVEWHHRLNGHKFEQTPGVGDGQGGLACCNPLGHKQSDRTEQLYLTELKNRDEFQAALKLRRECGTSNDSLGTDEIEVTFEVMGIDQSTQKREHLKLEEEERRLKLETQSTFKSSETEAAGDSYRETEHQGKEASREQYH